MILIIIDIYNEQCYYNKHMPNMIQKMCISIMVYRKRLKKQKSRKEKEIK